jgi:hypothetical protein
MLNGQELAGQSKTTAVLEANQVLHTGRGKAEILLTPGVFVRVGDESAVKMISPDLADTQVAVTKGSAILEVDELFKQNDLTVSVGNSLTRIDKDGLYDFHSNPSTIAVLDGEAIVREDDAKITVKKRHELLAHIQPLKTQKFDVNAVKATSLYRWSKLRSEYEAQANASAAQNVIVYGGWCGPGWYWAPFWNFYAFMPGAGMLYSPFGWGFYSPIAFESIRGPIGRFGYAPRIGHIGCAGFAPRMGMGFHAQVAPRMGMGFHRGVRAGV